MVRLLRLITVSVTAFAFTAAYAQQVTIDKDSTLHAEPKHDAPVVMKVPKGTTAEAIGKQQMWVNLKTPKATGWLPSFNVRFAEASAGGPSGTAVASRLFGGDKPKITATIGMRGLDTEDLKRASFDGQQLTKLDSYAATKEDGETAAQANGLAPVKLDYLRR